MSIDFLICNYNGGPLLKKCIDSIIKLGLENYNVLVYDNCSTDESFISLAYPENKNIILYWGEENIGYGRAINHLYRQSSSEYIFILNPDAEIPFNAHQFYAFLESSNDSSLYGFKILNVDLTNQNFIAEEPNSAWIVGSLLRLAFPSIFEKLYSIYFNRRTSKVATGVMKFVSGCALFMRSEIFKNIGMFNEAYFLYFEDTELLKRTYDLGYTIVNSNLPIIHNASYSFKKANNSIKIQKYKSSLIYFRNNKGPFQYFLARFSIFIVSFLGLINPVNIFLRKSSSYFYSLFKTSIKG